MKPGGQRAKGHAFERQIAAEMRRIWPNAKRGFQARGGGQEQADVEGTPFHLECKHGKKVNVRAAMAQAIADTNGRTPVVVFKDDRKEPLVVMLFEDWLEMAAKAGAAS